MSMQAAYIEQPGPVGNIAFGEFPLPQLHDHDVLVRVHAVTVDHVDTYIRGGAYPVDMPLPFILGRDMAGTVERVGEKVERFRAGDPVWSNCLGIDGLQGTFAEYVAAPEDRLYPLPRGVEPREAVAAAHSGLAAVIGLDAKARLAAGDTLFIHGGSGGVGTAVLQIAKTRGARVGATAGDEDGMRWCRDNGADVVVNYHREDIGRGIRELAPQGLDVYWEATPAFDPERVVPLMAQGGRLVVIAGSERPTPLPMREFYQRNCTLHGFTITGTNVRDLRAYARRINAWLSRHTLKAGIQEVMPLSQAAEAHRKQEQGGLSGKLVLVPES